jgi:aspartate/methionine/tyrosine aminotransferase
MTRLAQRVSEIPSSATVRIADVAASLRRQGVPVVDLSAGRAVEHTPPYIVEAAVEALRGGQTHQTMSVGTPECRQACAAKLGRDNGIDADPDREIVVTMGVKQGLTLALMATVGPGDEVIVEDPCFVSYQPLIRMCGGVPVSVPLRVENGFRWRREDLESRITPRTRAILFNSPHNPTGIVHVDADLDVIADVARRHDLVILSDEVYERVTWNGRRHVSIASRPDVRHRTVTVMGLTKTFSMGGWRIGFVHAEPGLTGAMASLQQHLITCASSIAQAGATVAFGEPPRPEVLALWREWEQRCLFVAAELRSMPGVTCHDPEGGYYAWPDIRGTGWDDTELAEALLQQQHVAVVPGAAFGASGRGYLRLTCVRSWPELKEAMGRITSVLREAPVAGRSASSGGRP